MEPARPVFVLIGDEVQPIAVRLDALGIGVYLPDQAMIGQGGSCVVLKCFRPALGRLQPCVLKTDRPV